MSENCLICGNPTEQLSRSYAGFQAPAVFQIQSCPNCDVSYSLPRVDATDVYNNIYRVAASIPGYSRYWKYMSEIKDSKAPLDYLSASEEAYWGVATALKKLGVQKQEAKCIEIGSGLGYLTYALGTAGYDIRGLDLSTVAVENAKKIFGDRYVSGDLFEFSKANENQFDIAILTEVIEHVEDPMAFLKAIKTLLKPNGKIVLTTPNKSFFPKKIVWASTPPPIHCYWFSEKTLGWLAEKLNASLDLIDFSGFYTKGESIDISTPFDYVTLGPILNEKGELVSSRKFKNFVKKLPFALKLYAKLNREMNAKETLVCGKRGVSICAILEMDKSKD